MDRKPEQDAERLLAEQLIQGEQSGADPKEEAVRRLPPRWEIRIQTEHDPVVEETFRYRAIASEVDDRYNHVDQDKSPDQNEKTE
jgi:hypothetical protein